MTVDSDKTKKMTMIGGYKPLDNMNMCYCDYTCYSDRDVTVTVTDCHMCPPPL